jgi:hypothetical protein
MSFSDTIPMSRFAPSTTGSRRIWCVRMICSASATLSSGLQARIWRDMLFCTRSSFSVLPSW